MTPLQTVQAFVGRINAGDVDGLVALMTEDHRFTDSLGQVTDGQSAMRSGWIAYFGMVSNYRLTAEHWLSDGPVVVMLGTAAGTCSPDGSLDPKWNWTTPAACRAAVRGNLVAEWRVYADNEPIRQLMRTNAEHS